MSQHQQLTEIFKDVTTLNPNWTVVAFYWSSANSRVSKEKGHLGNHGPDQQAEKLPSNKSSNPSSYADRKTEAHRGSVACAKPLANSGLGDIYSISCFSSIPFQHWSKRPPAEQFPAAVVRRGDSQFTAHPALLEPVLLIQRVPEDITKFASRVQAQWHYFLFGFCCYCV